MTPSFPLCPGSVIIVRETYMHSGPESAGLLPAPPQVGVPGGSSCRTDCLYIDAAYLDSCIIIINIYNNI